MKSVVLRTLYRQLVNTACIVLLAVTTNAYAAKTDTVTFCSHPNWMPYEAVRDGQHIGLVADYLDIIGRLANVKFKIVPTSSWQQSLEYVQTGKCLALSMIQATPNRKRYLTFTTPYFASPHVLLSKRNSANLQGYAGITHEIVGVVKDYRQAEYIARYYPNIKVEYVNSEGEGLQLLAKGKIDVLVASVLSVNALINKMQLSDIVITGFAEPNEMFSIGVNKAHAEVVDRLNVSIGRIPESEKFEIFQRWNQFKSNSYTDYRLLVLMLAGLIMILTMLMWRKRVSRQYHTEIKHRQEELETLQSALLEKNRTLEFLSSHDSLTGLYNRNYMLHKIEDEVSRFQRFHTPATMMLIDLACHCGPVMAERKELEYVDEDILKKVADTCLGCIREVDVAARWATDQFLILCPQTPISAARVLADRLKFSVENNQDAQVSKLQICIGIASLQEHETYTEWYDRVSQALGNAKRSSCSAVMVAEH